MRCIEIENLLDLYMDDALAEEVRARVDRHLLKCAQCAFHLRALEQTLLMLRDACPPAEPSPSFRERWAARLQDAFTDHLRVEPVDDARQRSLPFPG